MRTRGDLNRTGSIIFRTQTRGNDRGREKKSRRTEPRGHINPSTTLHGTTANTLGCESGGRNAAALVPMVGATINRAGNRQPTAYSGAAAGA